MFEHPRLLHSSSTTTTTTRNVIPLQFLFVTRDDFVSLHPNFVLSYNEVGIERSPSSSNTLHRRSSSYRRRKPCALKEHIENEAKFILLMEEQEDTPMTFHKLESRPSLENDDIGPLTKVMDSYGLLEHILSFMNEGDLLSASLVNQRYYYAARCDDIWKNVCERLWSNKHGFVPVLRKNGLGLFWRSFWDSQTIDTLSVKAIKGLFLERPLGRSVVRESFINACIEKSDLLKVVQEFMPEQMGGSDYGMDHDDIKLNGFRNIWFGSFASSMLDSKRTIITLDELLSKKGYSMHFKIMYGDEGPNDTIIENNRQERIRLHFHCICYFLENNEFHMDVPNEHEMYHPLDLEWQWVEPGKQIRVGNYPSLHVRRLSNWGWKLENINVVMFAE